ncbi:MAG: formate dehydrogenase accessory sulfurtransferase FdhD [Acidimicrobiales bacterium]
MQRSVSDVVATEEPLEIRLIVGNETLPVAVTMRTPGADFELAAGFLFSEGVIASRSAVRRIAYCIDRDIDADQRYNIVTVELAGVPEVDLSPLERHFSITSACGVCGKASIDALRLSGHTPVTSTLQVRGEVLSGLDNKLRDSQRIFESTGGLHAAAVCSASGDVIAVREDVGRHNALDKLIGWAVLNEKVPLSESVVLLSGRASFELVQKSLVAGVPVVCSVSAPSSLAIEVAETFGITLVGFLRGERFKIYAHRERVALSDRSGLLA